MKCSHKKTESVGLDGKAEVRWCLSCGAIRRAYKSASGKFMFKVYDMWRYPTLEISEMDSGKTGDAG